MVASSVYIHTAVLCLRGNCVICKLCNSILGDEWLFATVHVVAMFHLVRSIIVHNCFAGCCVRLHMGGRKMTQNKPKVKNYTHV